MEDRLSRLREAGRRPGGLVGLDAHAADLEAYFDALVGEVAPGRGATRAVETGAQPSAQASAQPSAQPGGGRKAAGLVKVKKRACGPVKLLVIYGPSACGKRTLAEAALDRAGFVQFRPAHGSQGPALFGSALDFCKSSVSGVAEMMRGASAPVRGKALLIYDSLGGGTRYSAGALADEIRAALRGKNPPWPVVLVATTQASPGKSGDLSRSADARLEVPHPGWRECHRRLVELFCGEAARGEAPRGDATGCLTPERLLAGAKRAAGGGMVASLTAAYNLSDPISVAVTGRDAAVTAPEDAGSRQDAAVTAPDDARSAPKAVETGRGPVHRAPPMYSGFFEKVRWAISRANEPPDSETYRQVHSAISNEPALAALMLRETYSPHRQSVQAPQGPKGTQARSPLSPPPSGPPQRARRGRGTSAKPSPRPVENPLAEAKRRLAYMSLANGVEEFRGSEGMASEMAAAAFEGMAAQTDPETELSFPMSYTVASARSNSIQRGPGRPPRPGGCPREDRAADKTQGSAGEGDGGGDGETEQGEGEGACCGERGASPWAACNATVTRFATRRLDGALLGLKPASRS